MKEFLLDLLTRLVVAGRQPRALAHYAAMVEQVLAGLGVDGQRQDDAEGSHWTLQVGSAMLAIDLAVNEVLAEPTLAVSSAILRLPPHDLLPFYRRCLELNRILVGCSIGVEGDVVLVASERSLIDLNRRAVARMLLNVASAADQFDDDLAEEFGAEPLGQEG